MSNDRDTAYHIIQGLFKYPAFYWFNVKKHWIHGDNPDNCGLWGTCDDACRRGYDYRVLEDAKKLREVLAPGSVAYEELWKQHAE